MSANGELKVYLCDVAGDPPDTQEPEWSERFIAVRALRDAALSTEKDSRLGEGRDTFREWLIERADAILLGPLEMK